MSTNTASIHLQNKELELLEFYVDYIDEKAPNETSRINYGINLAKIIEVIHRPVTLTSFPYKGHEASIGSFTLRNQIVSVIDLAKWLDVPTLEENKNKVIIISYCGKPTGFLVSDLGSIYHLTWADVIAPNEYVGKFSDNTIIGVIQKDDKLIYMLDVEQVLSGINPSFSMKDISSADYGLIENASEHTVIIAEDSSPIRAIIAKNLEQGGYNVVKSVSGKDCYDKLLKFKQQSLTENKHISSYIDVIITDIEMPEMDGYALTKKVKEDEVLKELPVILFSSLITEEIVKRGNELGAVAQISKPDLPVLAQTLSQIIIDSKNSRG